MSDLKKIKEEFLSKLKSKLNLLEVNQLKNDLFGKNGLITNQFKKIGSIPESERKNYASELNLIKDELMNLINMKISEAEIAEVNQKLQKENFALSLQVVQKYLNFLLDKFTTNLNQTLNDTYSELENDEVIDTLADDVLTKLFSTATTT